MLSKLLILLGFIAISTHGKTMISVTTEDTNVCNLKTIVDQDHRSLFWSRKDSAIFMPGPIGHCDATGCRPTTCSCTPRGHCQSCFMGKCKPCLPLGPHRGLRSANVKENQAFELLVDDLDHVEEARHECHEAIVEAKAALQAADGGCKAVLHEQTFECIYYHTD